MPRGAGAGSAESAERDLLLGDAHAFGKVPDLFGRHGGVERNVRDGAALGAEKVSVFLKIRAEA